MLFFKKLFSEWVTLTTYSFNKNIFMKLNNTKHWRELNKFGP